LEGVREVEEPVGTGEREVEKLELSDDSSNFSGDNDNILAECIQSGMPKVSGCGTCIAVYFALKR
jgi:hypothetical protein